ncbi:MAG: hypothetical protein V1875_04700 [Candidatus Altiarchaeota archaeon]
MDDKDELGMSLDGQMTSMHLLALVLEYRELHESEAQRKLEVGLTQIKEWKVQLQTEGLLEPDDLTVDSTLKVTKAGLKRLQNLKKEWITQAASEETNQKNKPAAEHFISKFVSSIIHSPKLKETFLDALILSATLLSLYLLKIFLYSPNVEVISFLMSTLFFAVALVVYQQYKNDLKAREFIGFFRWVLEQTGNNRKYILAIFVALIVVYSAGMILLTQKNVGMYVLISVLASSSILVIFARKRNIWLISKFYLGVALLVVGLMLLAGLFSATEYLVESSIRWLDIVFGLGILFVTHMNEKTLGLAALSRKH